MSHRVYVPASATLLRTLRDTGRLGAAPLRAHGVTEAVRTELGALGVADEEELEYAAMTAASLDALRLLGPADPDRRIVVAVDVARLEPLTGPHDAASAVLVPDEVPLRRLAAVLADSADAEPDVGAARQGDEAALERCLDHELGWYAAQELGAVLGD